MTASEKQVLDEDGIERALARIAHEILERNQGMSHLTLVGIRKCGVFLAERLQKKLFEIEKKEIPVAAAGYAWMKYLGPHPSEAQLWDLYHKDRGHPGPKGTYIYACLLYACITGRNPAGLASEFKDIQDGIFISRQEATRMQKAAWEQYLENSKQAQEKQSKPSK